MSDNCIWNKEELPELWKESSWTGWKEYLFTRRVIKLTVVIIVGCHCYQLHTKFYPVFFFQGYDGQGM
jgi:hypothetical protein